MRRYEKRTWLQATEAKVSRTMALAAEVLERELPKRLLAWKKALIPRGLKGKFFIEVCSGTANLSLARVDAGIRAFVFVCARWR